MSSTESVQALVLHGPKDLRLVRSMNLLFGNRHTHELVFLCRSRGQHLHLVQAKSK